MIYRLLMAGLEEMIVSAAPPPRGTSAASTGFSPSARSRPWRRPKSLPSRHGARGLPAGVGGAPAWKPWPRRCGTAPRSVFRRLAVGLAVDERNAVLLADGIRASAALIEHVAVELFDCQPWFQRSSRRLLEAIRDRVGLTSVKAADGGSVKPRLLKEFWSCVLTSRAVERVDAADLYVPRPPRGGASQVQPDRH